MPTFTRPTRIPPTRALTCARRRSPGPGGAEPGRGDGTDLPQALRETYAPQLSVTIFARGLLKAVRTRVFLAPLDAIKDDPLVRAIDDPDRLQTLVATRDLHDPKIYRWDIRLQGAGEAAFIEF